MDLQKEEETSRDSTTFGWTTIICQPTLPGIYEVPVPRIPFPRCFLPSMATGSCNESGFLALPLRRALDTSGSFLSPQERTPRKRLPWGEAQWYTKQPDPTREDDDDTSRD